MGESIAGLDPARQHAINSAIAEDRLAEAEAMLRQLLPGGVGPIKLIALLGRIVRAQGRIAEAMLLQEAVIANTPGDYSTRFDLSETYLIQGDFVRGWREYEHRYRMPHTAPIERRVLKPRWTGGPLDGKVILLHDEQGYGDTFQFMRLVPRVQAMGGHVVLQVNHDTYELAARMGGFDQLLRRGELPPPFDLHCELMSLPLALGLSLEDLPASPMPYLSADPARVRHWRRRLSDLPRPLIAIVWAGRPTHFNDRNRSTSLDQWAPLAATGATFVAIQKGPRAGDILTAPLGMKLLGLDREIRDFEDSAAILAVTDLLISVDSAPVHLAGAMGRPVWTMLPLVPDWRWLLDREDTPWYPSMRLFRQRQRGDWAEVFARLAQALSDLPAMQRRRAS